ncbi:phosphatidate cytidylyltransferase [Weissella ceti]|uniref:Phosphatidate cytidylyltransferase n=1 Tax=Weissella ceti TaxID=759620 RepID=A0ABT3E582_9LACO|nr:phosphatidate cytidylyltransferase [Weissella ceti]MCW0953562.1 phosphatidate cytidylyltransferase [Weissella ceti]QVK12217.1 phosphatidate cytidylyltransferase [Weissella ceti]
MKTRVITAVIALAIFVPIVLFGEWAIQAMASLLALIATSEIVRMRRTLLIDFGAILAMVGAVFVTLPATLWQQLNWPILLQGSTMLYIFVLLMLFHTVIAKNKFNFEDAGVFTITMIYVGMGFHSFVQARDAGISTIFFVLLIVWITDSGAYMVGRKIGKNKLAPNISPNKTWEGSIGGTLVAVIVAAIYVYFFPQHYGWLTMVGIAFVVSVAGQFGDLMESALKRFYKVKDSGDILPGHGGILDRFDSMLIAFPVFFLLGGF